MRTWQEIAKETLAVQDASDLILVVRRFLQVAIDVKENLQLEGRPCTFANVQQHPICRMWSEKIYALTHARWSNSQAEVERLAAGLPSGE